VKLIDENTVCDDLGISKSTLYKWCGIHDDSIQPNLSKILPDRKKWFTQFETDVVTDFPKPYKIGRVFKWKLIEIEDWLQTKRT
jgi:predicted DNA-binding transcriptional regulator AlpA